MLPPGRRPQLTPSFAVERDGEDITERLLALAAAEAERDRELRAATRRRWDEALLPWPAMISTAVH